MPERSRTTTQEVARIQATGGVEFAQRILLAQLMRHDLKKVIIIVFRYQDFDLVGRQQSRGSPTDVIRLLTQLRDTGTDVTFVTRDPFAYNWSSTEFSRPDQYAWYRGLQELEEVGATVKLNPNVHAKVYLFESETGSCCYAVGSSNLTVQGMFKWAELNISGYHGADYLVVKARAYQIINDQRSTTFAHWEMLNRLKHSQSPLLGGRI